MATELVDRSEGTRREAIAAFVKRWTGRGFEKGETSSFWLEIIHL